MPVDETYVPRVVPALRGELSEGAMLALAKQRARQFLQSQTAILVFALAITSVARWSGWLGADLSRRYLGACAVTALVTAAGWALLRSALAPQKLVLGLLVVDALVGYPAVYFTGGLDRPAAAGLLMAVVMTPLFAGKRYLSAMAVLHWVVYGALVYVDAQGLLSGLVPAWLLPDGPASSPSQVAASFVAFSVVCFGTTFLVSLPSLDTARQKVLLSEEVDRNTAALERTSGKLARANADLAGLNSQLQSTNGELVTVNADLATVVAELEHVNAQLGQSNAELARTNRELEDTNLALQRSNERLDQFNTAVSHDLRAPLQAMMARAELAALAAHTDPARVARMADQICESATRMARQLDEMHKLSRLEDRLETVEEVALAALLGDIVQDLEPKIRARRVNLEVVHPLPRLMGNGALLSELFQNLIDNAIKYGASDQPRVRVSPVDASEGWVAVAVEDNGPGIPTDQRDRVFQLFRRLTRDQEAEGVGAGLAIVRRIVGAHGGTAQAEESTVLGGARFVVRLPAVHKPERPVEGQSVPDVPDTTPRSTGAVVAEA